MPQWPPSINDTVWFQPYKDDSRFGLSRYPGKIVDIHDNGEFDEYEVELPDHGKVVGRGTVMAEEVNLTPRHVFGRNPSGGGYPIQEELMITPGEVRQDQADLEDLEEELEIARNPGRLRKGPPAGLKAAIAVDGVLYTGTDHGDAINKAKDAGVLWWGEDPQYGGRYPTSEDGDIHLDLFQTADGEVFDRFDAAKRYGGWAGFNPGRDIGSNPAAPKLTKGYEGIQVDYRVQNKNDFRDIQLNEAVKVYRFAKAMNMLHDVRERMYIIYVNNQHSVLGYRLVGASARSAALVDPPLVFGPAVALAATSMFSVHNHPSGNLRPSPQDLALYPRLDEGAKMLGFQFMDHVIASRKGYSSKSEHWQAQWIDAQESSTDPEAIAADITQGRNPPEDDDWTPGVEAWLEYLPTMVEPNDAEYLKELGLAKIQYVRKEPRWSLPPKVMATVKPTAKARRLSKKLNA